MVNNLCLLRVKMRKGLVLGIGKKCISVVLFELWFVEGL